LGAPKIAKHRHKRHGKSNALPPKKSKQLAIAEVTAAAALLPFSTDSPPQTPEARLSPV
jgi:hypothetical protein